MKRNIKQEIIIKNLNECYKKVDTGSNINPFSIDNIINNNNRLFKIDMLEELIRVIRDTGYFKDLEGNYVKDGSGYKIYFIDYLSSFSNSIPSFVDTINLRDILKRIFPKGKFKLCLSEDNYIIITGDLFNKGPPDFLNGIKCLSRSDKLLFDKQTRIINCLNTLYNNILKKRVKNYKDLIKNNSVDKIEPFFIFSILRKESIILDTSFIDELISSFIIYKVRNKGFKSLNIDLSNECNKTNLLSIIFKIFELNNIMSSNKKLSFDFNSFKIEHRDIDISINIHTEFFKELFYRDFYCSKYIYHNDYIRFIIENNDLITNYKKINKVYREVNKERSILENRKYQLSDEEFNMSFKVYRTKKGRKLMDKINEEQKEIRIKINEIESSEKWNKYHKLKDEILLKLILFIRNYHLRKILKHMKKTELYKEKTRKDLLKELKECNKMIRLLKECNERIRLLNENIRIRKENREQDNKIRQRLKDCNEIIQLKESIIESELKVRRFNYFL